MIKAPFVDIGLNGLDNVDVYRQVLGKNMWRESLAANSKFRSAYSRLNCLMQIYPTEFHFGIPIEKSKSKFVRPHIKELKDCYTSLCLRLDVKNREREITSAERRLRQQLQQHSKKKIYRSVWIGSHCVDLFIANLRSNNNSPEHVMRGLAIEVDGDCHNHEAKMAKDERKGTELQALGIAVTHIHNWDFNKPTVQILKATYRDLRPLDSRERRRLWCRIYAFTLAIHLSDNEFFRIFRKKQ